MPGPNQSACALSSQNQESTIRSSHRAAAVMCTLLVDEAVPNGRSVGDDRSRAR